ncbi:class I SAM-dependent methyltransferase [Pedobacter polaris]|uniref:Class I SAM-dependent methyltransferase n=1 Tax=Pedobacter polaris TaxID=2571273 RepID=A0A4V5P1T3_9SPHI|nr:class I SAM-dependent methyltransferase [Pedobacter polaris]TKC04593.1 class I SAM-dependent methyltransferase [Pedobacter polaris]
MSLTEEQLKELASQLSKPNGEQGINVGNMMHDSNIGMTMSTANALKIADNDQILELGHGNGKHIKSILNQALNVSYFGLEIAELMKKEAASQDLNNTSFYLYDGEKIPFVENTFHKAMTVNTIYFWKNPVDLLNEIYNVLKPEGIFCIGFAQKEFMKMLPFTQHGFNLYDDVKFKELVNKTPFKLISLTQHTEKVKSKADEMIDRAYTVATLQKAI